MKSKIVSKVTFILNSLTVINLIYIYAVLFSGCQTQKPLFSRVDTINGQNYRYDYYSNHHGAFTPI